MIAIAHHQLNGSGNTKNVYHVIDMSMVLTGFPQALEILENLENHKKKFHAWRNHGIGKKLKYHGKIMEFLEIIQQNHQ